MHFMQKWSGFLGVLVGDGVLCLRVAPPVFWSCFWFGLLLWVGLAWQPVGSVRRCVSIDSVCSGSLFFVSGTLISLLDLSSASTCDFTLL